MYKWLTSFRICVMGTSSNALLDRLIVVAEPQSGYFTASQAVEAGYADSVHGYHLRNGDWVRMGRGIYRLASMPEPDWPELVISTLWSRGRDGAPQGVFAMETALQIYGYLPKEGSVMHMIVPQSFRRNTETPRQLRLYKEDLPPGDTEQKAGFRVTTLEKTIRDLASRTHPKIIGVVREIKAHIGVPGYADLPVSDQPVPQHRSRPEDWDEVWDGQVREPAWSGGKTFEEALQSGED
jgi:predicted transcriptional regulator of viral defense system